MNNKEYNGYYNYETWLVALWIDNEKGSQDYVLEVAKKGKSKHELADLLKALVEENMPDLGATLFSDLLRASLSEVNWRELAVKYKV